MNTTTPQALEDDQDVLLVIHELQQAGCTVAYGPAGLLVGHAVPPPAGWDAVLAVHATYLDWQTRLEAHFERWIAAQGLPAPLTTAYVYPEMTVTSD